MYNTYHYCTFTSFSTHTYLCHIPNLTQAETLKLHHTVQITLNHILYYCMPHITRIHTSNLHNFLNSHYTLCYVIPNIIKYQSTPHLTSRPYKLLCHSTHHVHHLLPAPYTTQKGPCFATPHASIPLYPVLPCLMDHTMLHDSLQAI